MDLDTALKTMLDAQEKLRTPAGVNEPAYMSKQMMRLAQATGAVEEHLAHLEKVYEVQQSEKLREYLVIKQLAATNAEKRAKIDLAEIKGQIAYLSRIVQSAWRQVSTIQSRWNHLLKENAGQI